MKFESLKSAYKTKGFIECDDGANEAGFTKVALYSDANGDWTHAAVLKESGQWSSKLGRWIDISHERPSDLDSPLYGNVQAFMKKPL